MRVKLIFLPLVLCLALYLEPIQAQNNQEIDGNQWYDSIIYDGYTNFNTPISHALTFYMLAGDTLDVSVSSQMPVNVIITDNLNSYTSYITYGKWGDTINPLNVWSYYNDFSVFNTQDYHTSFQNPEDRNIYVIVDDASGTSNNAAYVKIIRNQQYSDDHHNQIATARAYPKTL